MRKINLLLLMCFILGLGYANAQSSLPQVSTDDSGPWYYIQVEGKKNDPRANRVLTGDLDDLEKGSEQYVVFGTYVTDEVDIDKQMWRFEKNENEEYVIINKFWNKQIDIYFWEDTSHWKYNEDGTVNGEQIKDIAVITDNAKTRWTFTPSKDEGYWLIGATNPLNSNSDKKDGDQKYLHQGNARWNFRTIMEGSTWGVDYESRYQFVLPEDMNIRVVPRFTTFGSLYQGDITEQYLNAKDTLTVSVYPELTGDMKLLQSSADSPFYIIPMDDWNGLTGGQISVQVDISKLGASGLYNDTVYIEATRKADNRVITVPIPVSLDWVSNVPVDLSPSVEMADTDKWYYISFNNRYWKFLTDKGENTPLEGQEIIENDPSQLWKVVKVEEGKYTLVSKLGNQIEYIGSSEEEEVEIADRFISVKTPADGFTYSFDWVSTKGGKWQIKWNEYDGGLNEEGNPLPLYINKTNTDDQVTGYGSLGDNGSLVVFMPVGTKFNAELPTFSTDTDSHWYYIQFNRRANDNKVIEEVEGGHANTNIVQRAKEEEKTSQYWKFLGIKDDFLIQNYSGKVFKVSVETLQNSDGTTRSQSFIRAITDGENGEYGNSFTMTHGMIFEKFHIQNLSEAGEQDSYTYLNDYQGTAICQYVKEDGGLGGEFNFIPVEGGNSIEIIGGGNDNGNEELGNIIATYYYTLQGVQLGTVKPSVEGIYIEKNIHESNKVSARKIYIPRP